MGAGDGRAGRCCNWEAVGVGVGGCLVLVVMFGAEDGWASVCAISSSVCKRAIV